MRLLECAKSKCGIVTKMVLSPSKKMPSFLGFVWPNCRKYIDQSKKILTVQIGVNWVMRCIPLWEYAFLTPLVYIKRSWLFREEMAILLLQGTGRKKMSESYSNILVWIK